MADFFDFSEFQSKKKRLSYSKTNYTSIFFSFSDKNQSFSINLYGEQETFLDFSRYQRIKVSIHEKNGMKNIVINSSIQLENKLRFAISIQFGTSYQWDESENEEFLIIPSNQSLPVPLFKDAYDSLRFRLHSKKNPEFYEWSDIAAFPLLIDKFQSICLKSRVYRDNLHYEYFNITLKCERKPDETFSISLNYPTKISNFLPFPINIKIKNIVKIPSKFEFEEFKKKPIKQRIDWIFDNNLNINEILNFSMQAKKSVNTILNKFPETEDILTNTLNQDKLIMNGILNKFPETEDILTNTLNQDKLIIKPPEFLEETINPGSHIYSNLLEYLNNFTISLKIPSCSWSSFLSISPEDPEYPLNSFDIQQSDNIQNNVYIEDIFPKIKNIPKEPQIQHLFFQNFDANLEQTTVILERKLEYGIHQLVFFAEYWLLNETPFPIISRIKENTFEYAGIKLAKNSLMDPKEKPKEDGFIAGLTNFSAITKENVKNELNTFISKEEDSAGSSYFSGESIDKRFISLNSAYFSSKELKQLIKKSTGLKVFSGNIEKINKKISFRIENNTSWSEWMKMPENKSTILLNEKNDRNIFNFNYLNVKLPGKFNRTSLIMVSNKYFLLNLTEYCLEIKLIEGINKKNLIKLDSGMIGILANFKEEEEIGISVRLTKNEYLWTSK